MTDWQKKVPPVIMGGTPEERDRLITLLIGKITWLEHRQNALADCIEDIFNAADKLEEVFAILRDDLRDDS